MKINVHSFTSAKAKGFTLLELLVAMSVTLLLLGMVTYMTGASMDGYKGSRDKVVAGRQAKQALDAITKDFEAMVARADGSDNMWLHADVEPKLVADNAANTTLVGPANKKILNASRLIFFTGAPDRYDGDIGGTNDNGGDVSALAYRLVYRDQISDKDPGEIGSYPVFTLYRQIIDPDETFLGREINPGPPPTYDATKALLGVPDLKEVYELGGTTSHESDTFTAENVLAENIYELTVTFLVQTDVGVERITIGQQTSQHDEFTVAGNGLEVDGAVQDGQLVGVEISMTVLSERGLVMTEKGGMTREDIIKDYGIHYTHTVNVPRF